MDDITLDEQTMKGAPHGQNMNKIVLIKKRLISWWSSATVLQKSASLILTVISLGGVIFVISGFGESSLPIIPLLTNQVNNVTVDEPEEPKDKETPLTGELVTASDFEQIAGRKVLAVVIENHPDTRPQSGLDQADVVYETLAEGGISRFIALYQSNEPEVVGPVRSVRKYFLDLIGGYNDPLFMHIGGAVSDNPEANALTVLSQRSVKSLGLLNGTFYRVSDRVAPHNAYSNTVELRKIAQETGWTAVSSFSVWQYKDAVTPLENVAVPEVSINWGSWGENAWSVRWRFDADTNQYMRSHQTTEHTDALTGKQLSARNVVVLSTDMRSANDGTARIVVDVMGSGVAKIFRDGTIIEGTWSKPSWDVSYIFKDANGQEILLNRGNTWIMVVPLESEVSY